MLNNSSRKCVQPLALPKCASIALRQSAVMQLPTISCMGTWAGGHSLCGTLSMATSMACTTNCSFTVTRMNIS